MRYTQLLKEARITNTELQLNGPSLVRVDINTSVVDGQVVPDAMRTAVCAPTLWKYAQDSGLAVMAHQGRKGDSDYASLETHRKLLADALPDLRVDFMEGDWVAGKKETREKIAELRPKEILLLDNVRQYKFEKAFDAATCPYIDVFNGVIGTCVNDSGSTWHREDASLMVLPHISGAPTYVGSQSYHELEVIEIEVMDSRAPKGMVSGGLKPQKVTDLVPIYKTPMTDGYAAGVFGQSIALMRGYDLGEKNNSFIKELFSQEELQSAEIIGKLNNVRHPVDFTVEFGEGENQTTRNVDLRDMKTCNGTIVDIGMRTLDEWVRDLQSKEKIVRAGPLGKSENPNYNHGTILTKKVAGPGLVVLGGDASYEIVRSGLLEYVTNTGGKILIGGGSWIHRLADGTFPSLDEMIAMRLRKT